MRLLFLLVFLFMLVTTPVAPALAASPPTVVVSIAPQKWLVDSVAGNAVSVLTLATPGANPHSYEPTPQQMRGLLSASLYFTLGVPFEQVWLPRLADTAKGLRLCDSTASIIRLPMPDHNEEHGHTPNEKHNGKTHGQDTPHTHGEKHHEYSDHAHHAHANDRHHNHGDADPHVWLSPRNMKRMATIIEGELATLLPEKAHEFARNRAQLDARLDALDATLTDIFASAPSRTFLTFHPTWQYFAADYGLTELSIEQQGREPGPKTMRHIIDKAKQHQISVVFIEPQFPKAAAQAVAANINAVVVQVDPLAEHIDEELLRFAKELARSWK